MVISQRHSDHETMRCYFNVSYRLANDVVAHQDCSLDKLGVGIDAIRLKRYVLSGCLAIAQITHSAKPDHSKNLRTTLLKISCIAVGGVQTLPGSW